MIITVNKRRYEINVEDDMPLLWVLRDELGITGPKYGCGIAYCGACTVHIDGLPIKSCTILARQVDGKDVTTIEGLADGDTLHPMQEAFRENHALQCGFCTPGMVMSAIGIVDRNKDSLDEKTVREELEGNFCRCTGYHNIVKAILAAHKDMTA